MAQVARAFGPRVAVKNARKYMILNNIHGVDKTLFHIKAARSYIQSNTMNGRSMPMRHVYLKLGGLILATFAAAAAAQAHEADGVDQAPAMPEVLSTVMPLMGRDTGVIIHRGPAVTPTPTPARAAYDPTAPRPILITQGDRRATTILRGFNITPGPHYIQTAARNLVKTSYTELKSSVKSTVASCCVLTFSFVL
jgi:hypothetical protein